PHREVGISSLVPRIGQLCIVSRATAGAGEMSLRRRFLSQQLGQTGRPSLMHGDSNGRLHGLQIQTTGPASLGEDPLQEGVYFASDLAMDFSSRFFSCGVQAPCSGSAGRRRQIFSLTAIRSALTVWNRWNSSTSRWALRKAAGVEKLSVTVLPSALRVRRNCGSWPASLGWAQ